MAIKLQPTENGYVLPVYVQPGASRDDIVGEHDGMLKVAVSAPPERGKANKAVRKLLAAELGMPASHVKLVSGQTSRRKEFHVRGVDTAALTALLG
jgi:hypothetical protein